jgi:hypothetical protein
VTTSPKLSGMPPGSWFIVGEEGPEREDEEPIPDTRETLLGPCIVPDICDKLGIPTEAWPLISICELCDEKGEELLRLSIGPNYQGVVPLDVRAKLQEVFGCEEQPRWYLDKSQWHWSRVSARHTQRDKRGKAGKKSNQINQVCCAYYWQVIFRSLTTILQVPRLRRKSPWHTGPRHLGLLRNDTSSSCL